MHREHDQRQGEGKGTGKRAGSKLIWQEFWLIYPLPLPISIFFFSEGGNKAIGRWGIHLHLQERNRLIYFFTASRAITCLENFNGGEGGGGEGWHLEKWKPTLHLLPKGKTFENRADEGGRGCFTWIITPRTTPTPASTREWAMLDLWNNVLWILFIAWSCKGSQEKMYPLQATEKWQVRGLYSIFQ